MKDHKVHQGRNIRRFREMLGMKQDALALELGADWTQKKISMLEAREQVDPEVLKNISKALKVPKDALENFDEETVKNIISTIYADNSAKINYSISFNPFEKIVELFERMLKEKDDLISQLENRLQQRNNSDS